ncbi:MAG: hypothetical protein P8K08_05635 [Fuerstiella sp.]|nr:hypothetical protein [Fuerstiella sp.]
MSKRSIAQLYRVTLLQPLLIAFGVVVIFVPVAVKASESKPKLKPHPLALPNTHDPGEVDKPELVPFVVKDTTQLPGIVVDETEAELVGKWQYSTHTPPYVGLGYLHDQKQGKGASSVTFTPELPAAGVYEVRLSHCYNVRRSTNTPVTIHHADGEKTVRINQQDIPQHDRLFRSLGHFRFESGRHGWVRVSTDGTDGKYVIADAVQFLPVQKQALRAHSPDAAADSKPRHYKLTARASEIDSRVKSHPEIGFLVDTKDGKPADLQHAAVDTRVTPRGKLVIWLMSHNEQLFDRINSYGIHVLRPHYANRWFSICCREAPVGEHCRGNIRLEAATGMDFSDDVMIPEPDGMMERSFQFVKWLESENPAGNWGQFLTGDNKGLRWEDIIISGSSHGSTTAARFAKHQKVSRVVAFCGPRDQLQSWQSLPSATPENRYFGFSHVLDGGWTGDHYCRSWELLGMHRFGPVVNVDNTKSPFKNTRRLITDFDVGGDARRAHSSVQPGSRAYRNENTKAYMHEDVWRYLFTHPVNSVGRAVPMDADCEKNQR